MHGMNTSKSNSANKALKIAHKKRGLGRANARPLVRR